MDFAGLVFSSVVMFPCMPLLALASSCMLPWPLFALEAKADKLLCFDAQSPAMAADIDRLGDSSTPVATPAVGTSLISESSAAEPNLAGQVPMSSEVLENGSTAVPGEPEEEAAGAQHAGIVGGQDSDKSEPDIR